MMSPHEEPIVIRTTDITTDEMIAIMQEKEGHTLTSGVCPICRLASGCIKRPQEEPKVSSALEPSATPGVHTPANITIPTGITPQAYEHLRARTLEVREDQLVVLMTAEEQRKIMYALHGGILFPQEIPALTGCLHRSIAKLEEGKISLGANQIAVTMTKAEKKYILDTLARGHVGQTPKDTEMLMELEKSLTVQLSE